MICQARILTPSHAPCPHEQNLHQPFAFHPHPNTEAMSASRTLSLSSSQLKRVINWDVPRTRR
jgi:hypothetical protein